MLIIETRQVTFACGDRGFYRVAYLSESPGRELALCNHIHPSPLAAQHCEEVQERAIRLWTAQDFEEAMHL
jgi:hypothetical protein